MSNSKVKINRKYKDRLFRLIFGGEDSNENFRGKSCENIISLYNALNGTNHDADDIEEITTIEDVIYIKMKNDVSFLIDSYLSLWEQQSTYNPNMPVRGLMYFGNMYGRYIDGKKLNIYGKTMVKIPTPKYIVFYNGKEENLSVEKLKLSDAFINPVDDNEFEWTATMINLNEGKNESLLERCKPLKDYMTLINYVRENEANGFEVEEAIDQAVQRCIDENVLADFLKSHRAEVMDVCLTEYDENTFVNGIREEGFNEGLNEGLSKGRIKTIAEMFINGGTEDDARRFLKATDEEIEAAKEIAEAHTLIAVK